MTERKAFKVRVRAHMVQTGQSYARAAAILEAGNPARPRDTHPASALVIALLRSYGIDLTPDVAFGIGGGIGFMCAVFTYAEVRHPLLTIVCQHHPAPWAPAMLERLGVPHISVDTKTATVTLLESGEPVILPMARADLGWMSPSGDDREEHIVLAIPDGDGHRVLDGSGAWQSMPRDEVVRSYMRSRRKHPVLAVSRPDDVHVDVDAALAAGLRNCVDGFTKPVLGNSFDANFGLAGLQKWARLADSAAKSGWPALFGDNDVWRARLVDCIDKEHTAPTAGRPLFARTLRAAQLAEAADYFERSARDWRNVSHRAASGTITFTQLAHEAETITHLETQGIRVLAQTLTR